MKRHHKFGAAFVAISLGGTGVAFALWSANGVGTSSAKALSAQTLTVTAATPTADLYPGYTKGAIAFSVNNPNPYAVTVTSMTPGAITSSNPTGCPSTNVTVASATGLSIAVGANATATGQSVANVVSMASTAPDACQGVTFTVALTLAGSQ
ncbi:MAG: hypothetical protein WCI22_04500 [Actinomycetota bacterium]